MTDETVRLPVAAAKKREAGRGVARLPEPARSRLGVLSGDTVVIEGDRQAVAKVWPGTENDVVRIDADTRANAGVTVGDEVTVRRVTVSDATRVTLDVRGSVPGNAESLLKRSLLDRPLRAGDTVHLNAADIEARVTATDPDGVVMVTETTTLSVQGDESESETPTGSTDTDIPVTEEPTDASTTTASGVAYEDIGGLDEELDLVREMVELPLSEPELFREIGVDPPRGVLLHGPPGTGKTLIARAVANEVNASFRVINGPEIVSKYKGDSEERLRTMFEEAADNQPAIIFIDELDAIGGERDEESDMENRLVAQLLTLLDGLESRGQVIVIGATNRVDAIDPALRRGGRFDREIEIGAPDETGRREILDVHTRAMALADDVNLDRLAARTHGFVGADVKTLTQEAAMAALRDRENRDELRVTRGDFDDAMASVDPSAMREYVAETPTVDFADVGGLEETKTTLREAVEWPVQYAPLFEAADTEPASGVLLYGPPGTGKTLLARALAGETGVNFLRVAGPELLDRYVGESEKAVREVFDRARQAAPSIVFLDEIDALAGMRGGGDSEVTERVVSQLLTEMDNAASNPRLAVLAATNRQGALDEALLRPGRLETHIEVPNPDEESRRAILGVHTDDKPLADDVDLAALATSTEGFSGAELASLVREASMYAIRAVADGRTPEEANEHTDEVVLTDDGFEHALTRVETDE
ncbi:AAA family ATPase [Halosegnis rubeus]|jgi:transitional endoplasmic reticulum ATPase|uniref:AAA family ATPase n=1 Tax=Halosegnis rubeus TaxID=2212850 RepID=A0A5N5U5D7_9EURY|nr:AAA family ATPase [Halosegnis rubeus]KAB7513744.1 AAA family ATPase [Halosegnis rubeus]KAB7514147.1 AAA family ATPase [Halosegnis rubeus]